MLANHHLWLHHCSRPITNHNQFHNAKRKALKNSLWKVLKFEFLSFLLISYVLSTYLKDLLSIANLRWSEVLVSLYLVVRWRRPDGVLEFVNALLLCFEEVIMVFWVGVALKVILPIPNDALFQILLRVWLFEWSWLLTRLPKSLSFLVWQLICLHHVLVHP